MSDNIYGDGSYRNSNPDWHSADSGWKADRVAAILAKNKVEYRSCVEVGCGAGKILSHLARQQPAKSFVGYDVSPDAAALWVTLPPSSVTYRHEDFTAAASFHDLLLLIDVFEHVEDYMGFLRKLSNRARWFVFHIPLDMHLSALLRDRQLHAREKVGHLHYFSQATALATLKDTGFRIVDHEFTKLSQETVEGQRGLTRSTNIARRAVAAISPNLSAKLLGGFSLIVLCRGTQD
jgi:Methyltransferase domain